MRYLTRNSGSTFPALKTSRTFTRIHCKKLTSLDLQRLKKKSLKNLMSSIFMKSSWVNLRSVSKVSLPLLRDSWKNKNTNKNIKTKFSRYLISSEQDLKVRFQQEPNSSENTSLNTHYINMTQ